MEDRKGVMQDIPLVAISIGIASTDRRGSSLTTARPWRVATEMKSVREARAAARSYAVDRRAE